MEDSGARVTEQNVREADRLSPRRPVVVDFWAPSCGPVQDRRAAARRSRSGVRRGRVREAEHRRAPGSQRPGSTCWRFPTTILFEGGKVSGAVVDARFPRLSVPLSRTRRAWLKSLRRRLGRPGLRCGSRASAQAEVRLSAEVIPTREGYGLAAETVDALALLAASDDEKRRAGRQPRREARSPRRSRDHPLSPLPPAEPSPRRSRSGHESGPRCARRRPPARRRCRASRSRARRAPCLLGAAAVGARADPRGTRRRRRPAARSRRGCPRASLRPVPERDRICRAPSR